MADPLSIASGIAGVLALAGQVVSTCYQYGCAVKEAPQEIQRLLDELMSLSGVLNAVKALVDSTNGQGDDPGTIKMLHEGAQEDTDYPPPYLDPKAAHHFETLLDPISDSRSVLEEVEKALRKAEIKNDTKLGRIVKRLIWPLKQKETLALITKLERSKALFMLSLNTAHLCVSMLRLKITVWLISPGLLK